MISAADCRAAPDTGPARTRGSRPALAVALVAILALGWTAPVGAQLRAPALRSLPSLPNLPGPAGAVDRTLSSPPPNVDLQVPAVNLEPPHLPETGLAATLLAETTKLRIAELLRHHGDRVELDPEGAPLIRGELVALSPSAVLLEAVRQAGYTVLRAPATTDPGAGLFVLGPPAGMATAVALERLRALDPQGVFDFNHLDLQSGAATPGRRTAASPSAVRPSTRIGLIDGGVAGRAPALLGAELHSWGCAGRPLPSAHGTAVASILVGNDGRFRGAAPGAALYAADVYCGAATGGAVDALAEALAWLTREQVAVVNISLVGPPNRILERLVQQMLARGHLLVAAVGNDGPAAPPLYPASYPDVIGVTAVDARHRVLPEAGRGPQVAFAAPGADMAAADAAGGYMAVRGTSFAAPVVAGLLATRLRSPDRNAARRAVADLAASALDLGEPGRDPVYGYGLVGSEARIDPGVVSAPEAAGVRR